MENLPAIDLTLNITSILALVAIVSPIITTLLNNKHQEKMKNREYDNENKKASFFYRRGVYEEYLRCVGQYVSFGDTDVLKDYGKIYPLALIYFPDNLFDELIAIDADIQSQCIEGVSSKLNALAPKIRTILRNM